MRARRRLVGRSAQVLLAAVCSALAGASTAGSRPLLEGEPPVPGHGFFVGFAEDLPKEVGEGAVAPAARLGSRAFRLTLRWSPGQTSVAAADRLVLDRAVAATAAHGQRTVLAVYADAGRKAPTDAAAREQYCAYVRDVLKSYPTIRDVAVWNEPNHSTFWTPQYDAAGGSASPAAYGALAARCWEVLHAARPDVNVIGPVLAPNGWDDAKAPSPGHSPGAFLRALGAWYRSTGHPRPLFDTIGHHIYGADPAERPWVRHIGSKRIGPGDWNKLMWNLATAFSGTAQPIPGQVTGTRRMAIWYLEAGFQTALDEDKRPVYRESENVPAVIPDFAGGEAERRSAVRAGPAPDQHTQILDGIRLAYCQRWVEGYFNFLLFDEPRLDGWQSGAFWADGTPKGSHDGFRRAIGWANTRTIDCDALKGGRPSADYTPPTAPAGATALVAAELRVDLAWSRSVDRHGNVAGYRIHRDGGNVLWTRGTAVSDTTVQPGTTYTYAVFAQDEAGNLSAPSERVTVSTAPAAPLPPPPAPPPP